MEAMREEDNPVFYRAPGQHTPCMPLVLATLTKDHDDLLRDHWHTCRQHMAAPELARCAVPLSLPAANIFVRGAGVSKLSDCIVMLPPLPDSGAPRFCLQYPGRRLHRRPPP